MEVDHLKNMLHELSNIPNVTINISIALDIEATPDSRSNASRAARKAELIAMPYNDYLQTPEWREKRERVLFKAKFMCGICGVHPDQFHIHHITYERRGYEWDSDLMAICVDCHDKHHDKEQLA